MCLPPGCPSLAGAPVGLEALLAAAIGEASASMKARQRAPVLPVGIQAPRTK